MIVVKITGGLGNQLFQYAMGRALAAHHNTNLKLDISAYQNDQSRNFMLNCFKIHDLDIEIDDILDYPLYYYKQNGFHFNSEVKELPNDTYLAGFWQSDKFFNWKDYTFRNELIVYEHLVQCLSDKSMEIQNQESVAVHIRRGDYLYLNNTENNQPFFGVLPIDYYNRAMTFLVKNNPSLRFYFFSDDIKWVQENMQITYDYEFITNKVTSNSIEDFYLMSKCKYHIIANSSFSWWSAWLGNDPNKVVIAPAKWFNSSPADTSDLIPCNWKKM